MSSAGYLSYRDEGLITQKECTRNFKFDGQQHRDNRTWKRKQLKDGYSAQLLIIKEEEALLLSNRYIKQHIDGEHQETEITISKRQHHWNPVRLQSRH